ncbi:MAG: 4Fe-4S binding protein [Lachnospiraceae bacterium]|nr:4Fe-4S binding protein [Lachnospiraceae bacterium]
MKKIKQIIRLIVQTAFFALTNGYVKGWMSGKIYRGKLKNICVPGLNCYSCPGALFSCPIGSLQAILDSGKYKFSLYVLGMIGLFGVLLGRLVCGWLCPFGFLQDLLYKIPFPKKFKNLFGHRFLKYLKYVILIVFVIVLPMTVVNIVGMGQPWFCEYICPSGTLLGGIPLVSANAQLQSAIGWRFWTKIAILAICVITSVVVYRPFCKYICPLGAIYGLFNPGSVYRFRIIEERCVKCGKCQKVCDMDIKVWEKPNSTECIRCGKCKSECPEGAITSTFDELVKRLPRKQESSSK